MPENIWARQPGPGLEESGPSSLLWSRELSCYWLSGELEAQALGSFRAQAARLRGAWEGKLPGRSGAPEPPLPALGERAREQGPGLDESGTSSLLWSCSGAAKKSCQESESELGG